MKRSKIRKGNEAKEVLFEGGERKRGHNRCTRGREEKTKEDTGRNIGERKITGGKKMLTAAISKQGNQSECIHSEIQPDT